MPVPTPGQPSPPKSRCRRGSWPRRARSLSLAVIAATVAPALEKTAGRVPAQGAGVVHHDLPAQRGVEEVVAADAVHGGRNAGDDREVVGIGEAGDHAVGQKRSARVEHAIEKRCDAGADRLCEVVQLAAAHADDHQWCIWPAIAPAIDANGGGVFHVAAGGSALHWSENLGRPAMSHRLCPSAIRASTSTSRRCLSRASSITPVTSPGERTRCHCRLRRWHRPGSRPRRRRKQVC